MRMELGTLAASIDGRLTDPTRDHVEVSGVSSLAGAGPGELAFLWSDDYRDAAADSDAEAIVCRRPIPGKTCLVVDDPEAAMLLLMGKVYAERHPAPEAGVHPTAVVSPDAELGEGVSVGPAVVVEEGASVGARTQLRGGAYIGRGVTLGEDCVIHPNATVLDHCRVGDRVVIWSGAVIGKDGFGFLQREGRHVRIPQIGTVIIEDDVEIGSLSNVARGAIDDTIIRRGVIVDDHCHIGHGSELGEYTVMVGRSGMGGSVKIGKRCFLLQDSALSTGRAMGDGAMLATNVRVLYKDVPAGETRQRPVITHPPSSPSASRRRCPTSRRCADSSGGWRPGWRSSRGGWRSSGRRDRGLDDAGERGPHARPAVPAANLVVSMSGRRRRASRALSEPGSSAPRGEDSHAPSRAGPD